MEIAVDRIANDPRGVLTWLGHVGDEAFDLTAGALALGLLDRRDAKPAAYTDHLEMLAEAVAKRAGPDPDGTAAAAALAEVLAKRFGYHGDREHYDDLDNANLLRVIDRRRGLPVALALVYLDAGRRNGWPMAGLTFPGHFLIRCDQGGERAILDPFAGGLQRGPADLRDLLKSMAGLDAELRPAHYEAVSDRAVLIRLANNIKLRQVKAGRLDAAVETVGRMLCFAPREASLWHELGLIHARLGSLSSAEEALEKAVALDAANGDTAHRAAVLLQQIKTRLN
jgi:regulator of sirC expression with transglutaminase-like and TPR domain